MTGFNQKNLLISVFVAHTFTLKLFTSITVLLVIFLVSRRQFLSVRAQFLIACQPFLKKAHYFFDFKQVKTDYLLQTITGFCNFTTSLSFIRN